jgi:type IV secretory pathway VirD2 relaxase
MRRRRRNFSQSDRIAIVGRASDPAGRVHCERCGAWCRKRADYQLDHVVPEADRPLADLERKLTPADGQLLCIAVCHPQKTKKDMRDIGKAKRLEAARLGVSTTPRRKINWGHEREEKPKLKVANGKSRIAREFGQ